MDRLIVLGNTIADQIELDMFYSSKVSLNLSINELGNISTRNSNYSNTFTIPRTAKNEKAMDFAGTIGNISNIPYQLKRCRYLIGTTVIVADGYLKLIESNNDSYRLAIFDGIVDLSEKIKDKSVGELNLTQYNHTLTETIYTNSFSNKSGYVYAFANYGVEEPTFSNVYPLEHQIPSLYVHTVINEIISQAGFTYEGDIFTDTDYLSLFVAPTNGYEIDLNPPILNELRRYSTNNIIVLETKPYVQNDEPDTFISNHTFTLTQTTGSGITLLNPNTLRADFDGRLQIDLSTAWNIQYGNINVRLKKNYQIVNSKYFSGDDFGTELSVISIPVSNGDVITMDIVATQAFNGFDFELAYESSSSLILTSVVGGQNIDFNTLYDELDQSSLLRDIMQRYGLIVLRDTPTNLKFVKMDDLLIDRTNAVDWTNKIISIESESFDTNGYARNNKFVYKYETDVDIFDYDGLMVIDNETLQDEKTIINSIFKIRLVDYILDGNLIYKLPIWEVKKEDGVDVNKPRKIDPTLFKISPTNKSINFNVYNGTATNFTGLVPLLSFNNIEYQHYVDNYYSNLNALFNNYKRLNVEVYLDLIDYNNLDFTKLVFLKQTGRYYYLNSVRLNDIKSTAELIEIRTFNQ